MEQIFVPKSHVIHFDPHDPCPEYEDPKNSTKWANLTRECQRADSVCLVSPIEIISIVDGSKGGHDLESETKLTTKGFLRGCASRRKLLENEPTIRFKANLLRTKKKNGTNSGDDDDNIDRNGEVFNMMSSEESSGADLSRLKSYDDGYAIRKVYSHEFFIDQYTDQATRCYQDNCNTKVRAKSAADSQLGRTNGGFLTVCLVALFISINDQRSWT
jgi:hypothetical protein